MQIVVCHFMHVNLYIYFVFAHTEIFLNLAFVRNCIAQFILEQFYCSLYSHSNIVRHSY